MTAATIPKISAALLAPVLTGASLLGALVLCDVEVREAELRVAVLVSLPNVNESEFELVKVAVLKVLFLFIAVPVPEADAAEVMAIVLLLARVVDAAALAVEEVLLEEVPEIEKRPE